MSDKIKEAIAELEKLPAEEQELAAEAILDFAERHKTRELSEEQAAEVRRRQAERDPKFLPLAEARGRLLPD
jgi:hypothetical protein